jgi:hypothetical protein
VGDGNVLRVFAFRPVGSETALDALLRDELLPSFLELPGLVDAMVGRHNEGAGDERVVVSVWESREAMTAELGETSLVAPFRPEQAGSIQDGRLDVLPVAVSVRVDASAPPTILRVFRGQAYDGELDPYVDEAREGALADADAEAGLVAFYLGVERPSRFVTVSAWTDWGAIERATGSDVHHPLATRHSERLLTATADHFEILPNTVRPTAELEPSEAAG